VGTPGLVCQGSGAVIRGWSVLPADFFGKRKLALDIPESSVIIILLSQKRIPVFSRPKLGEVA